MSNRSLALAMATLASMYIGNAEAQSVYVAPGGVYIAGGPVYVIPAPNTGVAPYVAPTNGYGYGPPAVITPPPVVDPTAYYAPAAGYLWRTGFSLWGRVSAASAITGPLL